MLWQQERRKPEDDVAPDDKGYEPIARLKSQEIKDPIQGRPVLLVDCQTDENEAVWQQHSQDLLPPEMLKTMLHIRLIESVARKNQKQCYAGTSQRREHHSVHRARHMSDHNQQNRNPPQAIGAAKAQQPLRPLLNSSTTTRRSQ